jgi:hypothetical protein
MKITPATLNKPAQSAGRKLLSKHIPLIAGILTVGAVYIAANHEAKEDIPGYKQQLKQYTSPTRYNAIIDSIETANNGIIEVNTRNRQALIDIINKFKEQARIDSIKNVGAIEYVKGLRKIK